MHDSRITPQTLITGHLSYLEQQLPASVLEFKQSDPLAEVWVIVPNQLTRLHLRRVLAKALGTVANVRFMTVTDLMHKLAEPVVMREGWRTLGESVVDPLFAEIINSVKDKLEYLAPVASTRGFRSALMRTRQELILHKVDPKSLNQVQLRERERTAKIRDVILLLTNAEKFLAEHKLHDGASLQSLALRTVNENNQSLPPTLYYGLYDIALLTRAVLQKVMEATLSRAFLPWQPDQPNYKFTDTLCRWYQDSGFVHIAEPSPETSYAQVRFVSAPKDSIVATEIIRNIIYSDEIVRGDAAVMLPNSASLLTSVLESRCRTSRLSPYIYQAKTLGQCAAGRGFAALANLLNGDFKLEQVNAFLQAAPFTQPNASMTSEWSRLAQESLVLSGESEWRQRITRTITKLERRAVKLSDSEEEETNLTALRKRIESGQALLAFLETLFNIVRNLHYEKNWQPAVSTLWEYYRCQTELNEEFADLTVQLEQASLLDQAQVKFTRSGLAEFILATLETPGMRTGTFGTSTPLIAPREQCLGASFAHVFLPGLNEGTIPRMQRQDPLLLDSDRKDINDTLKCALPLTFESQTREQFVFEMQLRSAREGIAIYASRADADGRPQLYSPYVVELMAKQRKESELADDVDNVFATSPNRMVVAHPLGGANPEHAISESEYNRLSLGLGAASLTHLYHTQAFRHALDVENARFNSKQFGKYEGRLQDSKIRKELAHAFSPEQPLAATSLEEYWKCPFRYFVLKQWEAYAPEGLDTLQPVTSRERGLLFHSILQRYHGDRINLPITNENYSLDDLLIIAHRTVTDYARSNPVGPYFSFAKLERDIIDTLRTYHDELLSVGGTWRTRHVEVSFGYGDNPFPDATQFTAKDSRFIRFKGRVDRWDSDDSGTQVAITDYKSGKGPQKHSRGSERRLQLGVYHMFAQSNAPDAAVLSCYFYLELDKNRKVANDGEHNESLEIALDLRADMQEGIFVPDPAEGDPSVCKHCTAKLACGAQRHSRKELSIDTVSGMRTIRQSADETMSFEGDDDE
ncbi:MAG: PD-(D/E)XK nuclease family protein [bacterium]|nr:PD-(D/E)XK nuclease family protein [bacterium]